MSQTEEPPRAPGGPAPLTPATARGEATRRRLLDAAEREFGERGFHATHVQAVTQRAGVSQGTFYLYFRSKEEIFATLVREIGHMVRRRVALSVHDAADLLDATRRAITSYLNFVQQNRGLLRIVHEAQFVDAMAYREYHEALMQGYRSSIGLAQQFGAAGAGDAEVRAWSLVGLTYAIGLRYGLWAETLPSERVIEELAAFACRGLQFQGVATPCLES